MTGSVKPKFSLALLGTRGIPAAYGGFETFADELSKRLVARGHSVTVYGRSFISDGNNLTEVAAVGSVRSIKTKTIRHKYLETPVHAITSNIDLFFRGKEFDVALLCNAANSPFAWMINLCGLPLAINVDGIERNRTKWNSFGKLWYRLGEWASTVFATRVIGDAQVIKEYYKERFNIDASMIPYGASAPFVLPGETLQKFGLSPQKYILYVSRLEPENNALGVIQAFASSGLSNSGLTLVIVGDAPYAAEYKDSLRIAAAGSAVVFTGFQFGVHYQELRSSCLFYIQATEVGGTHPALIEALAYGNPTIANGTPENIEVASTCALIYQKNDFDELAALMRELSSDSAKRDELSHLAKEYASNHYSWEAVTSQYETLLAELVQNKNK